MPHTTLPRKDTMNDLTSEERAEWVDDAVDAIRGRMILRRINAPEAYTALSRERVWRDELPADVLREACERLITKDEQ